MGIVRACLFTIFALFILIVPAYTHVLGEKSPYAPRWIMFSGMALAQLEVRLEGRPRDGSKPVLLDRYEILGYAGIYQAPRSIWRVASESEARVLARQLCKRVGERMEVHMRLRKATRDGWKMIDEGKRDACERDR
jgi:hypothetical protein